MEDQMRPPRPGPPQESIVVEFEVGQRLAEVLKSLVPRGPTTEEINALLEPRVRRLEMLAVPAKGEK